MQILKDKIKAEGQTLGKGILKVDSFMNHQIDPVLMTEIGLELAKHFAQYSPTRVLTAETSGIAPALATAMALKIPLVFARKNRPVTMAEPFEVKAPSHTKGGIVSLMVSPEYLTAADRILIVDDFLATAQTLVALADLVSQSGATLIGIGTVIEKCYSNGRLLLKDIAVPVISLASIESIDTGTIIFAE
jgi:xanthine phosphoribosyltransferase